MEDRGLKNGVPRGKGTGTVKEQFDNVVDPRPAPTMKSGSKNSKGK